MDYCDPSRHRSDLLSMGERERLAYQIREALLDGFEASQLELGYVRGMLRQPLPGPHSRVSASSFPPDLLGVPYSSTGSPLGAGSGSAMLSRSSRYGGIVTPSTSVNGSTRRRMPFQSSPAAARFLGSLGIGTVGSRHARQAGLITSPPRRLTHRSRRTPSRRFRGRCRLPRQIGRRLSICR